MHVHFVLVKALSKVFVERACRYLSSQMSHLGDAVLAGLSKAQPGSRARMSDHRQIRQRSRLLLPLTQVFYLRMLSCVCGFSSDTC